MSAAPSSERPGEKGEMPQRGPYGGWRCGARGEAADGGVRPPSATGRQSSIGRMSESPGEAARFLTRNAVDALPEGRLAQQLAQGEPLRAKLGVDPTAPDIHLGHTVVLRKLREFQDLGHTVVLIVGDYTARVGDPSGRSATRPQLDGAEIDANAETFKAQAFAVLDPDRTEVRSNGEWLDMPTEDLFRLARTSTVAQLLERDDFAKRYAAREPISVLELLYPLLQGYDSVAVDADVELGGTDQKFNLLLARDIQQDYGHAAPVDPDHAHPARHRRGAEDVQVAGQLRGRHRAGRRDLRKADAGPRRRDAGLLRPAAGRAASTPARPAVESKRAMARALAARFHGDGGRRGGRGPLRPPARRARGAGRDRGVRVRRQRRAACTCPRCCATRSAISGSEARRLLAQGGVRLDGDPLGAGEHGRALPSGWRAPSSRSASGASAV